MTHEEARHREAAYRYGRGMARVRPARLTGGRGMVLTFGRPLGLNPFDLWTPLYYAFDDGYEDGTRDRAAGLAGTTISALLGKRAE